MLELLAKPSQKFDTLYTLQLYANSIQVIGRLCSNKETMSLKTLCSKLARKPTSLDIMCLFDKPITILQPICDLLDNWNYDDDQGEYQPVYEEFGSILLLVLSFVHRYNLSPVDMGIRSPSSFTTKLLNQGHLSRALESLSEQEQSHLDGWIRGLFDNESGGLGDELMSSCPPQDFYLLVPTLFHHIVLACSTDNLSDEGLKGGLEYLVDTFLLPSLIPGITWLSSHLWESRGDANAVLQILSALITNPANISNNPEASQMLNSILNIIAKSLEHSLRWLQRAEPTRQDVEPLSRALRDNLGWERHGASDHTELEGWTSTPGGGLTLAVKNTVGGLVNWGLNPGININPANYTHRQVLVGLKILGAKRVLQTIIEEVKAQTELGNGSAVVDVATALICAPESAAWDGNIVSASEILNHGPIQPLQRQLTLRETLKFEAEAAPKLHKTDAFQAETIVRLYRRVEAQMAVQQPVMMPHAMDALTNDLHAELNANIDAGFPSGGMNDLVDGHQGMDDDLMSGFVGGGNVGGDDLLDVFGDSGMGDGLGF
jgi:mediator of RNA polymerase II transcription subunit 5